MGKWRVSGRGRQGEQENLRNNSEKGKLRREIRKTLGHKENSKIKRGRGNTEIERKVGWERKKMLIIFKTPKFCNLQNTKILKFSNP